MRVGDGEGMVGVVGGSVRDGVCFDAEDGISWGFVF